MAAPDTLVVVDTNVWISALLVRTGAPALLARGLVRSTRVVFSEETFAELRERLWLPKFDRYVTLEQRKDWLGDLRAVAQWVEVPPATAALAFSRDAKDDKFVHAALAAGTGWLVSGDQDLLGLAEGLAAQGLRILSPAAALALAEFHGRPGGNPLPHPV